VSSDQLIGRTQLIIYPREGTAANPNEHPRLAAIPTTADETDGLDVTSTPRPGFPAGVLVMMNSGPRNVQFYDWAAAVGYLPGSSNLTSR
jgi:3-phytase